MNVGFYYMANAMGRLTGTLVSGALYDYAGRHSGRGVIVGFGACFMASLGFVALSTILTYFINDDDAGLRLGPCLTLVKPKPGYKEEEPKKGGSHGGH